MLGIYKKKTVIKLAENDEYSKNLLAKIKGVGPVRTVFGLKFQVHLTKDFDLFLTLKCLFHLNQLVYVKDFN